MRNYYELANHLKEEDSGLVGRAIASGILQNAHQHLDLYFQLYMKEFKNKENRHIFQSLENLATQGTTGKYPDNDLEKIYQKVSTKTTKTVRQINFAYDALNFFAAREPLKDFYPVLAQQVMLLGKESKAKRVRGLDTKSPNYHLQKATKVSNEYQSFIHGLRNYLRKEYKVPLK